jgi:ligand-binding sensor domain-containing protein
MKLNRRLFFLCIVLLFNGLFSIAQQEGQFIDRSQYRTIPFTIVHYGTKHGLPQNQILDIVAKKNGNIILSTANGISEYNGTEFFGITSGKGYKKQLQTRLFWDEQTQQLFSVELGAAFNRIHPDFAFIGKFLTVQLTDGQIIGVDTSGTLFTRPISGGTFKVLLRTGVHLARDFYSDAFGYYIGNSQGLTFIDRKTGKQEVLIKGPFVRLKKNPYSGKLYALGLISIYEISNGRSVRPIPLQFDLTEKDFTDIAFPDATSFFVSTFKGLLYATPAGISFYDKRSFLPDDHLQSLYYSKTEECLFVGTAERGLLKLQMKQCRSYYDSPGIGDASIGSIIRQHDGTILSVGSKGSIYNLSEENSPLWFRNQAYAFGALSEIDNVLCVGSWGQGVVLIRNRQVIGYVTEPQLSSGNVHAVMKDSRGMIWVGSDKGISRGKTFSTIRTWLPKVVTGSIACIYELRNGTICVAGEDRVYLLHPSGRLIRTISTKDGLLCKQVRSFYEDKEGKLWIGTYNGGLYCYHKQRLMSMNRKAYCYLSGDAFTLMPDGHGFLLISSNKGLWAVSEQKLNDFYYDRIPYLVPFYFGEESGVWNTEFNGGMQNNCLDAGKGQFYFPSVQGYVVKRSDRIPFRKLHPEFKSISVNDTLLPLHSYAFERSTHTVQFDFFCPNFTSKFNLYYQYKLSGEGLPDAWSNMQKNGSVSFKMLPPGYYVLSIRAIDGFNDTRPDVKTYAFLILPHFYETSWFRGLIVFLIVVLALSISRYRYYRILQKRSKESRINNTILELKLKAIQSKMDPHFIFNALNNIIYLLNAEKYHEAEELVHDFSLLLRRFLEKSDHTFLSVGEELAIIDLYLLIEQKRYNRQFTYAIHIDASIRDQEIPTLLIQPLVENAIKHGISHTDRQCTVDISAVRTETGILITIADDGIGRKKAAEINQNRINHTSKGIQLVNEKIGIMQQKYGIAIRLDILDRTEDGQTGTISRLNITLL